MSGRNPKAFLVIGFLLFVYHAGLVFSHVYFNASERGTRAVPPRSEIALAEPDYWHNVFDLNRWDSAHYETIVREGYRLSDIPGWSKFHLQWYPGYPLLAAPLHWLTGWKVSFVFSLLSAGLTLAFWLMLWSPAMVRNFGPRVLTVASVLIVAWPGAFYWFAGMTEPLVALLILVLLRLWIAGRARWILALLAYATSVKQVFVPLALAVLSLEWLRRRPRLLPFAGKCAIALAGFIGFGLYCWMRFGDFAVSARVGAAFFAKSLNPLSLIDVPNYARNLATDTGATAFLSMLYLLVVGLRLTRLGHGWGELVGFWRGLRTEVPLELFLWWTALAYTAFHVLGSAYAPFPFASMVRYQTCNVSLLLLIGLEFRRASWWAIVLILLPIAWLFLFWQNVFTVQYWSWIWVD